MEKLTVEQSARPQDILLTLHGELTLQTMKIMQSALDEAQEQSKKLVLDMADVDFVDSSGLGLLVRTGKQLLREGGNLELVEMQEELKGLLRLTGLTAHFRIL